MKERFEDLIVYEIYPRSFFDSNGDGIGDLNGIREKVTYLADLGVNAVWLTPCFKSPNHDNGYDVADHTDIMDEFGTMKEWDDLRDCLHKNGIRIIMDLVLNHTSDQHRWFVESRSSKESPYRDYYYWAKTPNLSFHSFLGEESVWEYDDLTREYYLHTFAKQQPDLNWSNPRVRKEMQSVVDFWIDKGVDGFRCDAIGFIAKDFDKNVFINGSHIHDYLQELFDRPKTKGIFTVGECDIHTEEAVRLICGKGRGELSAIFRFDHLELFHESRENKLNALKKVLVEYQTQWQRDDLYGTVFFENHDQTRSINKYGDAENYRYESATMLAAMFMMLRGIPFLHQGEEIGVVDGAFDDIRDFNDPISLNFYEQNIGELGREEALRRINSFSRDNARRPMPWTEEKNVGFSAITPWLKPNTDSDIINVRSDRNSERSIFAFYQKLIALRKSSDVIKYGSFIERTDMGSDCFVYERTSDHETYTVICNFRHHNTVVLPKGELVIGNYPNTSCDLLPYETRIYVQSK